jgi:excisionase family DNA binding protein
MHAYAGPSAVADAIRTVIIEAVETAVKNVLAANSSTEARRLLSVEEAAIFLGLGLREVRNMITAGDLPAVRRGRRVLIDSRDLNRWIDNNKTQEG